MNSLFKNMRSLIVISIGIVLAVEAIAQEPIAAPVAEAAMATGPNLRSGPKQLRDYDIPGLDEMVNLRAIDDWDVVQLVEFLAYRGGLKNIVIGKGVAGIKTKLKFDGVTVRDALEVVLSVNNLAYTVTNGIITIMSDAEYRQLYGVSFYDHKQVHIRELKYADPVRVAALLAPLKSSIGTVVSDQKTGALILVDTPAKIKEMEAVIDLSDISTLTRQLPTETKVFAIQFADVDALRGEIEPMLTEEAGDIRSDARTRSLIVTELPHKMRDIERVIATFDRRQKQVFIEAKIVRVVLNDEFKLGVNWGSLGVATDAGGNRIVDRVIVDDAGVPHEIYKQDTQLNRVTLMDTVDPRSRITARAGSLLPDAHTLMSFQTVAAGVSIAAIVEALQRFGNTKVLSNPHVAVMDGSEARVEVNKDEPYLETRADAVGDKAVAGTQVKFIPVGVTLSVTPKVIGDMILADIKPEISSADYRTFDYGTAQDGISIQNQVPVKEKSSAETTVMVKSGQTVIVAGMIQNTQAEGETGVPILSRIPLLGMLFKTQTRQTQSSELIVFLTPRIITGEEPYLRMQDIKKAPKPLRSVGPGNGKKLKSLR